MMNYRYNDIANSFDLWQEYVDPNATMTEEEFDAMDVEAKVAIQIDSFGVEVECAECGFCSNDPQTISEHQDAESHSGLTPENVAVSSAHNQFYIQ